MACDSRYILPIDPTIVIILIAKAARVRIPQLSIIFGFSVSPLCCLLGLALMRLNSIDDNLKAKNSTGKEGRFVGKELPVSKHLCSDALRLITYPSVSAVMLTTAC